MEDKWFVYADDLNSEGNTVLHFHRSWTGKPVADVYLEVDQGEGGLSNGTARITLMAWEGNADYATNGVEQVKTSMREVCRWVMGVNLEDDNRPSFQYTST